MPAELNLDLARMNAGRAQLAATLNEQARASRELARAQAQLRDAHRTGADVQPAAQAAERARQALVDAAARLHAAHAGLRAESEAIVAATAPERLVGALDANVPVALLPVRLETRFADAGKTLRIRIYPDHVHFDAHTPELTAAEVAWASAYWNKRWAAGRAPAQEAADLARQAWRELVAGPDPLRAAYAARRLTPSNLDSIATDAAPVFPTVDLRAPGWTRTPSATALPDRFAAVGLRGGQRLFTRWGRFVPDALEAWLPSVRGDEAAPGAQEMPVSAGMKWMTDYAAAEEAGMGITVRDADLAAGQSLAGGLDRLIVIGVDWTLSAQDGAQRIAALLESQLYSRGLGVVPGGTPTNNTGDTPVAGAAAQQVAEALDPTRGDAASKLAERADVALATALALPEDTRAVLARAPGGDDRSIRTAGLMTQVLWSAVPGVFLDRFFESHLSDRAIGLLRDHAASFVRPAGPLPTLRAGRQPYGILPVVAAGRYVPDRPDGTEFNLARVIGVLRKFHWAPGLAKVPFMGRRRADGSVKLEEDLRELLGMAPMAAAARFRRVHPPGRANQKLDAAAGPLWQIQQSLWSILFELDTGQAGSYSGPMLSFGNKRPALADLLMEATSYALYAPFVQQGTVTRDTAWKENYLQAIAAAARGGDAGRAVLEQRCDGASLLEALAAQSACNELARVHTDIVNQFRGLDPTVLHRRSLPQGELVGTDSTPVPAGSLRIETPGSLARVSIPAVTAGKSLDEFVRGQLHLPGFLEQPQNRSLKSFLTALDELATRPPEEVDRAFRATLDGVSYRLDAWCTSLATRRLDAMRARQPAGLYYGAYGWVDELRPEPVGSDSEGYVAAPSIQQAITAALLRSGFLTHRGEQNAFNIDLSSERVRLAQYLLSGVGQGQSLASLLGYRFERGLRERGLPLARFILPIRLLCPTLPSAPTDIGQPAESIAARDVVDGVQLIELYRKDFNRIKTSCGQISPAPTAAELVAIEAELRALDNALDAAGDLCLAEGVHQLAAGNLPRSGAALAALDRQEAAMEFDVVRTPRSARGCTHRLLVLCSGADLPPAWSAMPTDSRARAEPRLNAWVASLLGEPARVALWGRITSRTQPGAAVQDVSCSLAELGLSPLSLVLSAAPQGEGRPTALEQLVASALWRKAAASSDDRSLSLQPEVPAGAARGSIGLAALLALLRRVRALVAGCRFADGRDFTVAGEATAHGLDAEELAARADTAAQAQDRVQQQIEAVLALDGAGTTAADRARAALAAAGEDAGRVAAAVAALETLAQQLTAALASAWDLGLNGSIPAVALPAGYTPTAADWADIVRQLGDQAASLGKRIASASARRTSAEASFAARTFSATDDRTMASVEAHRTRMQAVFGDDFPVLPVFKPAAADEAAASLADAAALLGDEATYPAAWLGEMALLRAGPLALSEALDAAELVNGGAAARQIRVMQLPHRPGQAWAARPQAWRPAAGAEGAEGLAPPHGCIALAAVGEFAPRGALAGIVVDSWQEAVPEPTQTAALSFHYDAPGARPPQAILLACAPDLSRAGWSFDALLDTVVEAAELARLRLVGPKQMNALANMLFPAAILPDGYSKDVPSTHWSRFAKEFASSLNLTVLGR